MISSAVDTLEHRFFDDTAPRAPAADAKQK
jgi:hypothetical protein